MSSKTINAHTEKTVEARDALAVAAIETYSDMLEALVGPERAGVILKALERGTHQIEVTVLLPSCDVSITGIDGAGKRVAVANMISAASTARN